jgi:membrane protein YdbS with pleckstrin-like domain
MQPWWSVYAAVAVMFIGAVIVVWLLPERKQKRLIRRFAKIVLPVPLR